jgi:two-component system response regulator HydG
MSDILVVDDDRSNCEVVSRKLSNYGYHVDVAHNSKAALEMVKHDSYRLALLDYLMPDMNGVDLYRRITELQPNVKGVFLTAHANINTIYPAISAGVERILAKPVDFNELIPYIEELVGKPE